MSLVRYVRKRPFEALAVGSGYYPAYKRARTAYKFARAAAPYAKSMVRAWRSRPKRKHRKAKLAARRLIGPPPGTSNAKCTENNQALTNQNTRTLYILNTTAISKTSTNQIHARQRDLVNIRGVKVCMEMNNTATNTGSALAFNLAVLIPKEGDIIDTTDFFRDQGSSAGAGRGKDFGTALTSNEFHCLPVNRDKYGILKHWRFRIPPDIAENGGRNKTSRNFYIPLKRQMAFDDGAGTSRKDVYLVWWCDLFLNPGGQPALTTFQTQIRTICYFREPKS